MTHSILGREERFDIDLSALKKRYHTQQGRNHPDKFTGKGRVSASMWWLFARIMEVAHHVTLLTTRRRSMKLLTVQPN